MMDMDGADIERLTDGTGEASNPCWNPDGQLICFRLDARLRRGANSTYSSWTWHRASTCS